MSLQRRPEMAAAVRRSQSCAGTQPATRPPQLPRARTSPGIHGETSGTKHDQVALEVPAQESPQPLPPPTGWRRQLRRLSDKVAVRRRIPASEALRRELAIQMPEMVSQELPPLCPV